jgi:glutamine amidotransferase
VGLVDINNTHPFLRNNWIFAHNGTIEDLPFLRSHTSMARLSELQGSTDSELFFAWLLTRLDDAGLTEEPTASLRVDGLLRSVMRKTVDRPGFGTINFLLSNGSTLYAHRFGKELFLLDRGRPGNCESAGSLGCPVSGPKQRQCVAVASEPITSERWEPLAQGTLVRIDLGEPPRWSAVT